MLHAIIEDAAVTDSDKHNYTSSSA